MWLVSFEPIFVHIYRCELVLTSTAMLPFDACLFPTCRDIAKLSMLSTWLKMCTSYLIKSIWTIAMMLLHTRHQVIILVDIILKCGICVELVDRIIMLFSCVIQPFKSLRTRQNPFSTPYETRKKKKSWRCALEQISFTLSCSVVNVITIKGHQALWFIQPQFLVVPYLFTG